MRLNLSSRRGLSVLAIALCSIGLRAGEPTPSTAALDQAFSRLQTYAWGESREPLNAIDEAIRASFGDATTRRQLEDRLAAVLASRAPTAAKQFVCERLSLIGSTQSVSALDALLASPELSHAARNALERIRAPQASEALRGALSGLDRRLKVGVINSLGALEDPTAVGLLTNLLTSADLEVAAAAAAALGRIATLGAVHALSEFRNTAPPLLQAAATDAWLMAAERLSQNGTQAEAARAAALEAVGSHDPASRLAGLRALGILGTAADILLLVRLAAAGTVEERGVARATLAILAGQETNAAMVAALRTAPPEARIELIRALAARRAAETSSSIAQYLEDPSESVRSAALEALRPLGSSEEVPAVIRTLNRASEDRDRQAAERTLKAITNRAGAKCADLLLAGLKDAQTGSRIVLLRLLGTAGEARALEAVRAALQDSEPGVNGAAFRALTEWPTAEAAPDLLRLAQTGDNLNGRLLAFRGYVRLCRAEQNPADQVRLLTDALKLAQTTAQKRLALAALGELHDPSILDSLDPFFTDPDLVEIVCLAAVNLAGHLDSKSRDAAAIAMNQVVQFSTNPELADRARKILERLGVKVE